MPKNNTGSKVTNLPTGRSEMNQSSANRKNSSRGITQDSFHNGKRKTNDFDENGRINCLVRSNSVAHTHRGDNSFVNQSIIDQQICIDGS